METARVAHGLCYALFESHTPIAAKIRRLVKTEGGPLALANSEGKPVTHMDISERRLGDVTILTLAGQLVLRDGEATLRGRIDELIQEARIDVVLNMHDVSYVDSSGIGALVEKYVTLRRHGGNLKLVCPADRCRHVLTITHLLPIFDVYESEDAAVRSFSRDHVSSTSRVDLATRG